MWLMHLQFLISKIILRKWPVRAASKTTMLGRHLSVGVPLHRCVRVLVCVACACDYDFEDL